MAAPRMRRPFLHPIALLAGAVLFMGLYPKPFTDVMHTSVKDLLSHVAQKKY